MRRLRPRSRQIVVVAVVLEIVHGFVAVVAVKTTVSDLKNTVYSGPFPTHSSTKFASIIALVVIVLDDFIVTVVIDILKLVESRTTSTSSLLKSPSWQPTLANSAILLPLGLRASQFLVTLALQLCFALVGFSAPKLAFGHLVLRASQHHLRLLRFGRWNDRFSIFKFITFGRKIGGGVHCILHQVGHCIVNSSTS